ncbi:MAG TPA: hypothetical protein VMT14_03870, partial [Burkholderiaceae bacterium]|nr:hypothetical protein [Burkholderiaceae bacterium]
MREFSRATAPVHRFLLIRHRAHQLAGNGNGTGEPVDRLLLPARAACGAVVARIAAAGVVTRPPPSTVPTRGGESANGQTAFHHFDGGSIDLRETNSPDEDRRSRRTLATANTCSRDLR